MAKVQLRLEMATRASRGEGGELAALMEYLQSGLVWGTLLFIAGAVLVLDALQRIAMTLTRMHSTGVRLAATMP
jgi:hypothetical protein